MRQPKVELDRISPQLFAYTCHVCNSATRPAGTDDEVLARASSKWHRFTMSSSSTVALATTEAAALRHKQAKSAPVNPPVEAASHATSTSLCVGIGASSLPCQQPTARSAAPKRVSQSAMLQAPTTDTHYTPECLHGLVVREAPGAPHGQTALQGTRDTLHVSTWGQSW